MLAIAAVLSRFDVVAVQEVRSDLRALRYLLKALGPDWGFTLTDVTKGQAGNDERMAFLFDTRRVTPSGLACEIVMPEDDPRVSPTAFARQFARTPYAVSFASAGKTFILVTLHVVYGKTPSDRVGELTAIAQWLAGWANEAAEWGHNLICLGDFNIDRKDDPLFQAFTSTGLTPPPALNDVPRTIFDTPGRRPLLRPDRLVRRRDERPRPVAPLHEGRQLRLRPPLAAGPDDHAALLADLRPLPPLGGVLGSVSTPSRQTDLERAAAPVQRYAAASPHDRADREPQEGIALCLSGGGYRAMLFHLGALWRLNETGHLHRLARVSSVSGGSIIAGVLALNWERLAFDDTGVAAGFDAADRRTRASDGGPHDRLAGDPARDAAAGKRRRTAGRRLPQAPLRRHHPAADPVAARVRLQRHQPAVGRPLALLQALPVGLPRR